MIILVEEEDGSEKKNTHTGRASAQKGRGCFKLTNICCICTICVDPNDKYVIKYRQNFGVTERKILQNHWLT